MGYTNYLLAQQKLVFKQRTGSKVTKRHDRAKTPFARTLAYKGTADADRDRLNETMAAIAPGELYRQIAALTKQLENLALSKAAAPIKPQVNRSFNAREHPELLGEATGRSRAGPDRVTTRSRLADFPRSTRLGSYAGAAAASTAGTTPARSCAVLRFPTIEMQPRRGADEGQMRPSSAV
jgi:hypothetical protein